MKKTILTLVIALPLFFTCNNNDNQDLAQENMNGFFINSDFHQVNKAYFITDLSTEKPNDFYIVITDGEIVSYLIDSNEFEFNDATTNSVIFRAIQNPNTPTALNFAPSGSYIFNSKNESFNNARFYFNCESANGVLETCQYTVLLEESMIPNVAIIDIERDDSTAIYSINFNIKISNSIHINGQYHGALDSLKSE